MAFVLSVRKLVSISRGIATLAPCAPGAVLLRSATVRDRPSSGAARTVGAFLAARAIPEATRARAFPVVVEPLLVALSDGAGQAPP